MSQSNLRNFVFALWEFMQCLRLNAKKHKLVNKDIINLNQKYESLKNEYLLVKEIIKEEDRSSFIELEERYKKLRTDILQEINN